MFNIEGGCYAKTVGLTPETEPEIHAAVRPNALLENVPLGESWYASTLSSETVRLVGLGASEKFNDDEDAHPRFITYLDRYMTHGEM